MQGYNDATKLKVNLMLNVKMSIDTAMFDENDTQLRKALQNSRLSFYTFLD